MTNHSDSIPSTMRAVRVHAYGGPEVVSIDEVPTPLPGAGQVLVRMRASGINPGEISIRDGRLKDVYPMDLPFGEGTDLAGDVAAVGDGVDHVAPGDAVLGWTDGRAAHSEYVLVPAEQVAAKPESLSFEQAGSLFVAGVTAVAAVAAVDPQPGETVVIAGAAGGVGVLTTQLAAATGATVIGLAGTSNHDWLREHGATPVAYGDGQAERVRAAAPDGVDAFIDLFGGGYVDLALDDLGVAPERVNTIIDFATAQQRGVKTEGSTEAASIDNLSRLADQVAAGELDHPVAASFPRAEFAAAYAQLAERHTRGKIVLTN